MTTELQTNTMSYVISAVLGIVAALIVVTILGGREFPLVATERQAVLALLVIGVVMCTLGGIGPTQSAYGWTHPIMLAGIVLGILALLVAGLTLVGANTTIGLIATDRSALITLTVIMVLKVVLVLAQRFITP